ncbi:MAG: DNA cytosine methyltransferase [Candidatus Microthrix sp.]|nr:DNA cytosine methyltransferase [Dermatophilaceae bacterium]MBP9836042.1 DNA cytosine methyltransferase [Candidatus Microthrix sp.]
MMIQAPKSSRMHAVSLFSGIGLLDLGLHRAGIETRIFCESDRAARGFLARRFPGIPIHPDVQELTADDLAAAGADPARAARDELTESLRDLVERVIDTGKEMTLTVVVNIEPGSVLVGSIDMPNEVAFEIGAGRPRSGGAA